MHIPKSVLIFCAVCAQAVAFAEGDGRFTVVMNHTNCLYRCGEEAVFSVTAQQPTGTVSVTVDNFGQRVQTTRTVDLAQERPFVLRGTLDAPGFLRLTIRGAGADFVWGVAYEPEKIRPAAPVPDDFDAFWSNALAKLEREVPLDAKMDKLNHMSTATRNVYYVSFATVGKRRLYGILSEPKDLTKGPYPVSISVPGAGLAEGGAPGSDSMIGLSINVHYYPTVPGCGRRTAAREAVQALDKAECDALEAKYGTRGYYYAGIGKGREEYYYYGAMLGINRAVNWLASRAECDRKRIYVKGTSQGGGMGLMLAALNRNIVSATICVPAMTDMLSYKVNGRQSGWPKIMEHQGNLDRAVAEQTVPYFDGASFATRIRIPIRFAVGFADVTCAPHAVYAAYNVLPAKDKAIINCPGMGHAVYGSVYKQMNAWQDK